MDKKMNKVRALICVSLVVEVLILFIINLFFESPLMSRLFIYGLIKNVILLGGLLFLFYMIEKNNLSVSEALNDDCNNIFMFGGIGIIHYDSNRNIVWTSDLFKELNINILGVKLLEWQPQLNSLFDDEDIKIIDIKGKKFEAYNSEESKLIYLKDVSSYVSIKQDYLDQQLVVAYITIDNYEQTLESVDEFKATTLQSKTSKLISEWANENGIILKRYKNGGYIALFNERIYKKQVEDKFSILDKFKEMSKEEDEYLTLSIGIGRDSRILKELDDNAVSALALTYSRGGDQVAVKSGDDKVRYFGGNSDTYETSNKVRSRVFAQSLAGLIKNSSNVLIMGHKFSDLDSLGASVGVARIAEAYGKETHIIIDYDSIESKTEKVVKEMKKITKNKTLFMTYSDSLENITKNTLLVVVDNHKPSLAIASGLLEKIKNKVIIDHHRRGEEFINAPVLTYLEPSASSTVELIIEICEYQNASVDIDEFDATLMYAGMVVDTNNFKQRVGVRTFQSAAKLRDYQADVHTAMEYLEDSFDETISRIGITRTAYRFKNNILIAIGNEDEEYSRTMLAKAGNSLLEISGIKATFVIGKTSKTEISVSARSGKDVNVQIIMENMGGGGHFSIAAAQFENKTLEQVRELLEETIEKYLEDRGV